jgi:hypothetical protein
MAEDSSLLACYAVSTGDSQRLEGFFFVSVFKGDQFMTDGVITIYEKYMILRNVGRNERTLKNTPVTTPNLANMTDW